MVAANQARLKKKWLHSHLGSEYLDINMNWIREYKIEHNIANFTSALEEEMGETGLDSEKH
jgi:hypothetical protein